jgi:hypothetical protein
MERSAQKREITTLKGKNEAHHISELRAKGCKGERVAQNGAWGTGFENLMRVDQRALEGPGNVETFNPIGECGHHPADELWRHVVTVCTSARNRLARKGKRVKGLNL